MDHRAALILAASFFSSGAYAAYATLSAPVGWTPGAGAAATYSSPVSPAQIAVAELGRINANAALTVNGTKVSVPAKLPLVKSLAKKAAAAAIFAHPGLRTAAAVARWLGAAGLVYDISDGLWKLIDPNSKPSTGFQYRTNEWPADGPWYPTEQAACDAAMAYLGKPSDYPYSLKQCSDGLMIVERAGSETKMGISKAPSSCPSGWYVTPAGCIQTPIVRTVDKDKFVELMEPDPRVDVDDLPNVVWPASWPVKAPEIQPMFIPTGNPVPNPNYDPSKAPSPTNQPFNQPGVKVVPAPTVANPWQVDLQPVNRPVDSAEPNPDPKVDPPAEPGTDGKGDKPRDPDKDTQDLCEKHPEIIACQKLEKPDDDPKLPTKEVEFNLTPEGGYSGAAVCPAPIVVTVAGQTFSISWQPFCDSLSMIRPMMLAMAWLMAAFILIGRR